jgi:hypothetical protein
MPQAIFSCVVVSLLLAGSGIAALLWATSREACAAEYFELRGKWVLEAIDGTSVPSEKPEIFFQIDGQNIVGYDGCNSFGGRVDQPTTIRRSQRACPSGTLVLPLDLSDPAAQLRNAIIEGNRLLLPMPAQGKLARFRRGPT